MLVLILMIRLILILDTLFTSLLKSIIWFLLFVVIVTPTGIIMVILLLLLLLYLILGSGEPTWQPSMPPCSTAERNLSLESPVPANRLSSLRKAGFQTDPKFMPVPCDLTN